MTVAMKVAQEKSPYPHLRMLVAGRWLERPRQIDVINPATGGVLGRLPKAGLPERDDAVAAAVEGFNVWRGTAPTERCAIMLEAVRLIRERCERIATVMTLEQGKPIAQSRLEVERAAQMISWDANEGLRLYGRIIPAARGMRHSVLRQPMGPVAAFSPWNFPASSPARKIGGALAAGCSLILKASEETPGTAILLAEAFVDAGLPAGVLNLLFGDPAEISQDLIARDEIRMITFTGSPAVGRQLAAQAGAAMKPALMELGGHAPVILCSDADPVAAAKLCVATKLRNAGQVCVAPTRFLVDAKIYDAFIEEVTRQVAAITMGDGLEEATMLGPLANGRRVEAMERMSRDMKDKGAHLICGGDRPEGDGFFFPLTVFADCPDDAIAMKEEVFGPIMLIRKVDGLDEALAVANSLPYALAAYAFTDSANAIERLGEELHCGNLAINHLVASYPETPFGGMRESGHGREGGQEGVEAYSVTKLVSVATRQT